MSYTSSKEDLCLTILGQPYGQLRASSFFADAALALGVEESLLHLYFPHGVQDLLEIFRRWADQQTIDVFNQVVLEGERTHEKIKRALMGRFQLMAPYHGSLKCLWTQGVFHPLATSKDLFGMADTVWRTLGDQSTDFNYYTKRGLLMTVYVTTFLYWLKVGPERFSDVEDFLEARLKNVLVIPKIKNTIQAFFGFGESK